MNTCSEVFVTAIISTAKSFPFFVLLLYDNKGNLYVKTIAGEIIDHAPLTFYVASGENISSSFHLNRGIVTLVKLSFQKLQFPFC